MRAKRAIRVALLYAAFGVLWILSTDRLLEALVTDPELAAKGQLVKGWLFVGLSSVVLYILVRTELRRTGRVEQSLRVTSGELHAVIESAPVAIVSLDRRGLVTLWNRAAEATFGWSESDVLGRPPPFVAEDGVDGFLERMERVLAGESLTDLHVEHVRKDGTPLRVVVSTAPLWDEEGRIRGVMAAIEDVTEKKRLREQFLHAQKMEAVGLFAGSLAHDFNNVLTAVGGHAQLAAQHEALPETAREDLAEICRTVERASALTRKLLLFSRENAGETREVDLNGVIGELRTLLQSVVRADIEVTYDLEEGLWAILADPGEIEQVVMNLVVNARDAMPDGGALTIRTRNVPGADAARAGTGSGAGTRAAGTGTGTATGAGAGGEPGCGSQPQAGDRVALSVQDEGMGMTPAVKAQLFRPFFTTKERGKGTGLGLSTVNGIVQGSDGTIEVESEVAAGTTFTLYLPAVPRGASEVPAAAESRRGRKAVGRGETILVVEDDPAVRRPVCRLLRSRGYEVHHAGTAEMAIRRFGSRPVDLVISDVVLPGMSGPDLIESLSESQPALRVLFTSGYSQLDLEERAVALSGARFLQKPFTLDALADAVREALEAPAARVSAGARREARRPVS